MWKNRRLHGKYQTQFKCRKTNSGFPITAIGYPSCIRSQGLQGYLNNTIEQRCPTIYLGSPHLWLKQMAIRHI